MNLYKRLLCLLLLLLGTALILYPKLTGSSIEHEQTQEVLSFAHGDTEQYASLKEAMLAYNEELPRLRETTVLEAQDLFSFSLSPQDYGYANEVIATIEIPSLSVSLPVYLGSTEEHLSRGAAILGGTSLPVDAGSSNCCMAAHCGWKGAPFFRYLSKLQEGDTVYLHTLWETRTYTVLSSSVISPSDDSVLEIEDGQQLLTLLTCHPYASGGKERLCVICSYTP